MLTLNNATSEIVDTNVCQFTTNLDEFSIIHISDGHFDNPKSKTKWMQRILKENPEAYIIFGGDNHDLMQGKHDKRSDKSALKEQFKSSAYWNKIIEESQNEWVKPYKDRTICWFTGNHESAVTRNLEFDFLDWLLDKGNLGNRLFTRGWVNIRYKQGTSTGGYSNFPIWIQHIPPAGGSRSKGMLSVDLLLAQRPDAKCIISEHIHQYFQTCQTVRRFDIDSKKEYKRNVWYIQATTLKAEDEGKNEGYFHEKIKGGGVTVGAQKLNFKVKRTEKRGRILTMMPEPIMYDI